MGDYFKPMRRKLGVVTLMMACVSVSGWVRSLTELDVLIRLNAHNTHLLLSGEGTISWERMWPIVNPRPTRWMYRHQSSKLDEGFDVPLGFLRMGFDFRHQSKIETMASTGSYIAKSVTWQIDL